jgi:hypothetical protein
MIAREHLTSNAAQKLGIKCQGEYYSRYREDPLLHSGPHRFYTDFPGYKIFLGVDYYPNWIDAASVVRVMGLKTKRDYAARYKEDMRLNSAPHQHYLDFPGWKKFLGKE